VVVLVSEETWTKTKIRLGELRKHLEQPREALPQKRLGEIWGFLNYVAQTYPVMASYLIGLHGLHMTIDLWWPNRDAEGWRLSEKVVMRMKDDGNWSEDYDASEGPEFVSAVPRLEDDMKALERLTSSALPPRRPVRCKKNGRGMYSFGDASKPAFGATIQIGDEIHYQYGQWSN
jgi:hypothetical protein